MGSKKEKAALHPFTNHTAPQFPRLFPAVGTLMALWVQAGDVPPSTHGCSAPLQPIPVPSYLGDAAVSPPCPGCGGSSQHSVPHSLTFQHGRRRRMKRRRRRTVHAATLPSDKRGQVGGAMPAGQEPGDEWEPSPAPSGSRENAGSAKPGSGFTTTTCPPWGKASHSRWETQPRWMKSLFQGQNTCRQHGRWLGISKTIFVARRATKTAFFSPKI